MMRNPGSTTLGSMLFIAVLAVLLPGQGHANQDGKHDPAPPASLDFAAGVLERSLAGWHIGAIAFSESGIDEVVLEVTMVDPARTQAQTFHLIVPDHDKGTISYQVSQAQVPPERRAYHSEAEFLTLLSRDPPVELVPLPYRLWEINGRNASMSLGPFDYHVVERHVGGREAPAALARLLTNSLDQGAFLVAVHAHSAAPGGFASVDFVLDGSPQQLIIHVLVDGHDRVVAVESRRPGWIDGYQFYAGELLQRLLTAKTVERIIVNRNGQTLDSLDLILDTGGDVLIDTHDFYEEMSGC